LKDLKRTRKFGKRAGKETVAVRSQAVIHEPLAHPKRWKICNFSEQSLMGLQLTRNYENVAPPPLGGAGTGYQRVGIPHTQKLFGTVAHGSLAHP
jgi:hypothetical protein